MDAKFKKKMELTSHVCEAIALSFKENDPIVYDMTIPPTSLVRVLGIQTINWIVTGEEPEPTGRCYMPDRHRFHKDAFKKDYFSKKVWQGLLNHLSFGHDYDSSFEEHLMRCSRIWGRGYMTIL